MPPMVFIKMPSCFSGRYMQLCTQTLLEIVNGFKKLPEGKIVLGYQVNEDYHDIKFSLISIYKTFMNCQSKL